MAFNHIIQKHIAADIASILLLQSRNRKNIEFDATAELHEVEVGDIITVQYSPLGIDGFFRVNSLKINADYTIGVTASEHTPGTYVFSDNATIYGAVSQIKYVGNLAQTKYYSPNSDGITWHSVTTPPPTSNEPTIPINTSNPTAASFNIFTFDVKYTRDWSLTNARQIVIINAVVSDDFVDQIQRLEVQEYSVLNKVWVGMGSFDPGAVEKVSGKYQFIVGVAMDGSNHQFKLLAVTDNNDRFSSATAIYQAPLSKYRTSKYVSF